jgi:hypothetical protein
MRLTHRAGRYRRTGLTAGLPEVVDVLAADCPKRGVGQFSDPCGTFFPDIAAKG